MNTADLIHISLASAICGAAVVTLIYLGAIWLRDARAARERRNHYIEGRTILHRI